MQITVWKYIVKSEVIVHENTQWRVQYMVHESNVKNTVSLLMPNKLTYVMVLVQIHTSLHFEHFIS